jgi:hypothetical protein
MAVSGQESARGSGSSDHYRTPEITRCCVGALNDGVGGVGDGSDVDMDVELD